MAQQLPQLTDLSQQEVVAFLTGHPVEFIVTGNLTLRQGRPEEQGAEEPVGRPDHRQDRGHPRQAALQPAEQGEARGRRRQGGHGGGQHRAGRPRGQQGVQGHLQQGEGLAQQDHHPAGKCSGFML